MATCAAGQPCCNASCGLCMQPGALCTQKVCSDLRWYYTCGARSICAATDAGTADAGTSLPSCGPDDKLNGACPTLGLMCDPRDNTSVACSCVRPNLASARSEGARSGRVRRGVRLRRAPHPSAWADGFSPSGGEVKSAVGKSRTPTIVTPDGPIRPFPSTRALSDYPQNARFQEGDPNDDIDS